MRKKIIVGNWKMNMTKISAKEFLNSIEEKINVTNIDVAFCPPYTLIDTAKDCLTGSNIKVGAQNVYYEKSGAYTGEISLDMLNELNIDYCIIGHSERRQYFNETDESVNLKAINLLSNSRITPIICVGENLEQRKNSTMYDVVRVQVEKAFENISESDAIKCVLAYEPIWAIGTGITASSEEAEDMCKYIRQVIEKIYNKYVSDVLRVQYGGSANSKNAKELLNMPNIDGLLVGGASLKEEFAIMVNCI